MEKSKPILTDEEMLFLLFDYAVGFDLFKSIYNHPLVSTNKALTKLIREKHRQLFAEYAATNGIELVKKVKENYAEYTRTCNNCSH